MSCTSLLFLGLIGAGADVVWPAIHGLTSTFLQGHWCSWRLIKAVGSRATKVLASKGFYVCPAFASPTSRALSYFRNSGIGSIQQRGIHWAVSLEVQSTQG